MTEATISQSAIEVGATAAPAGFVLSKQERLFFQCMIDAIEAHGIKPPKGRGIPKEVRRVVDYDHVKLLMAKRMPNDFDASPEGKERHRERVKMALKRQREALMNLRVVATSNPYIWHTGKHVRGFDHLL